MVSHNLYQQGPSPTIQMGTEVLSHLGRLLDAHVQFRPFDLIRLQ